MAPAFAAAAARGHREVLHLLVVQAWTMSGLHRRTQRPTTPAYVAAAENGHATVMLAIVAARRRALVQFSRPHRRVLQELVQAKVVLSQARTDTGAMPTYHWYVAAENRQAQRCATGVGWCRRTRRLT